MNYLQLLVKYPHFIAFGALHYFFSWPGQSFFLSLYTVYFLKATGLTQVDYGWLYGGATLLSSFILPALGKLIDRVMLRSYSLWIGLLFAMFCFATGFVVHPVGLFFCLAGLRLCGQGLMTFTGATAIARYFSAERGQALALTNIGISVAEAATPLLFVSLILDIGWEKSWWVTGAALIFLFLPLVIILIPKDSPFQFNPERKQNGKGLSEEATSATRGMVLRDPAFYIFTLVFLFMPFFMTGIMINKNLLGDINQWTEGQLALGLSLFGLTRLIMNFLGGAIVDRFSAVRTFTFLLIPTILGIIGLIWGVDAWWMFILFMTGGMSASLSSLTSTAMWAEIYGIGHLGAIRSIVTTAMQVATAFAPVAIGWGLEGESSLSRFMMISAGIAIFLFILAQWQFRNMKTRKISIQP